MSGARHGVSFSASRRLGLFATSENAGKTPMVDPLRRDASMARELLGRGAVGGRGMPKVAGMLLTAVLVTAGGPVRGAELTTSVPGVLRILVSTDEQPEFFSFSQSGPPGLEREMVE